MVVATVLALFLAACGSAPEPPATPAPTATATPQPTAAATTTATPAPPTVTPAPRPAPGAATAFNGAEVSRGGVDDPRVALTFDCGSVAGTSSALLEALRQHGLRVTFFVTGEYADRYPDLVQQIAADGHEVANHTYGHPNLTELDDGAIRDQLQRAETAIQRLTGRTTRPWMRMPFGARNSRVVSVVREAGYTSIFWSLDSGDWQSDATTGSVRTRVLNNTGNGFIVVHHCASAQTAEALPTIIQGLQARGLSIVTVSALLGRTPVAETVNGHDLLALVTKQRGLPESFVPSDLVELDGVPVTRRGLRLRTVALPPLQALLTEATSQRLKLVVLSAYRSYAEQTETHQALVAQLGEAQAGRLSAKPGHSEHQLGTAVDFTSPSLRYELAEGFAQTPEGRWLGENAHRHGFIMSYPEGKESLTGYAYEPWHFRYVGVEAARTIHQQGLTLETYLARQR